MDKKVEIVNMCHDIQVSLGSKSMSVAEYDSISEIGMMVRLALHIRGLPLIEYNVLKLVADYYLQIPSLVLKNIVNYLAEIEFLKIDKEGTTIKSILPTVPYFDEVYSGVAEFSDNEKHFNETESVAIEILSKLSDAPLYKSQLFDIGTDKEIITRTLNIGNDGGFILERRARGKDIIISPTYFMDNAELYTDLVAKTGAKQVERINKLLKSNQGWPLSITEKTMKMGAYDLTQQDIEMLKCLAIDGAVKPPSIKTNHSGENYFLFTPTPGTSRIHPGKKEIYERALALVASVRQGQLLPKEYAIRNPYALLSSFKDKGYLRANTEAFEQYKKLTINRMCRLEKVSGNWYRLVLIDSTENKEALEIAISLVNSSVHSGMEIDDEARYALQADQEYIESKRSSIKLREILKPALTEMQQLEIDELLLKGSI